MYQSDEKEDSKEEHSTLEKVPRKTTRRIILYAITIVSLVLLALVTVLVSNHFYMKSLERISQMVVEISRGDDFTTEVNNKEGEFETRRVYDMDTLVETVRVKHGSKALCFVLPNLDVKEEIKDETRRPQELNRTNIRDEVCTKDRVAIPDVLFLNWKVQEMCHGLQTFWVEQDCLYSHDLGKPREKRSCFRTCTYYCISWRCFPVCKMYCPRWG